MLTAGVRTIKLFTVVIYLFPSQMFESKDGAYPSGAPHFACKYKTKERLNDRAKHSSLLWHGINYDCKKVWSTYHRVGEPA